MSSMQAVFLKSSKYFYEILASTKICSIYFNKKLHIEKNNVQFNQSKNLETPLEYLSFRQRPL